MNTNIFFSYLGNLIVDFKKFIIQMRTNFFFFNSHRKILSTNTSFSLYKRNQNDFFSLSLEILTVAKE